MDFFFFFLGGGGGGSDLLVFQDGSGFLGLMDLEFWGCFENGKKVTQLNK